MDLKRAALWLVGTIDGKSNVQMKTGTKSVVSFIRSFFIYSTILMTVLVWNNMVECIMRLVYIL